MNVTPKQFAFAVFAISIFDLILAAFAANAESRGIMLALLSIWILVAGILFVLAVNERN